MRRISSDSVMGRGRERENSNSSRKLHNTFKKETHVDEVAVRMLLTCRSIIDLETDYADYVHIC